MRAVEKFLRLYEDEDVFPDSSSGAEQKDDSKSIRSERFLRRWSNDPADILSNIIS